MKKLALIVLDGWGIGKEDEHNGIFMSKPEFFNNLWQNYPHTTLQASGEYVGLPESQIGGSEVGHLTLGAGRVIFQELPRITKSLEEKNSDEPISKNANFLQLIDQAKKKTLNLIGMISPGGVHSHENHLYKLLEIFKKQGCLSPNIHFIADGRDVSPLSGIESAKRLINTTKELNFGKVVTLSGRFYAMDRDKNMKRTEKAIDLYISGKATVEKDLVIAFQASYDKKILDEFIEPVVVDANFKGIGKDEPLFFFNFRTDRMKQLVTEINKNLPTNQIFTMTRYDKSYSYPVIFEKKAIDNTVGKIISKYKLTQLRAAETEKYAHVTYFFNGGVERVFEGEDRILIESNKDITHDQMPEMKAKEIAQAVIDEVPKTNPNFILVNFANADMVGHTGKMPAIITAIKATDEALKKLCDYLISQGYICCITADHGNADQTYDHEANHASTAHSLNPVPFIIYDKENQKIKLNQDKHNGLSKVAGTVLNLMEIKEAEGFENLIL